MIKQSNKMIFNLMILCLVFLVGCQNYKDQLSIEAKNIPQKKDTPTELTEKVGIEELLKKARDTWSMGKIEMSQAYYIRAYELQPSNVEILKEMASVYYKLENNKLLEVCYRLILDLQPDNQETLENYGLLLIRENKIAEAEELLKKAIDNTQNWRVYNGLGIIMDVQGKHEYARFYYGKASLIQQDNPEILNNIGYSFYMEDQLEKAQGYFLWSIKLDKDFHKAFYNYALSLARQKKYNESLSVFSKVISLSEASNNIGFLAMKNGDYEKAEIFLKQAIKLSPKFYKKAHQNLQELQHLKKE